MKTEQQEHNQAIQEILDQAQNIKFYIDWLSTIIDKNKQSTQNTVQHQEYTNDELQKHLKSGEQDKYRRALAFPITCKDGFEFSVQASDYHYCTPRNLEGPYTHVEAGYPIDNEEMLGPYAEVDYDDYVSAVYPQVPVGVILSIINKHGGVMSSADEFQQSTPPEEPKESTSSLVGVIIGGSWLDKPMNKTPKRTKREKPQKIKEGLTQEEVDFLKSEINLKIKQIDWSLECLHSTKNIVQNVSRERAKGYWKQIDELKAKQNKLAEIQRKLKRGLPLTTIRFTKIK